MDVGILFHGTIILSHIFKKNCMYHNFVLCEGAADTGVRGRSSECNFIMKISCIHLAFCKISSLPSTYYICMYLVVYFVILLGYLLKILYKFWSSVHFHLSQACIISVCIFLYF